MSNVLLLAVLVGLPADDGDRDLVETLRDAQATHRAAWSSGRAHVKTTVTKPGVTSRCIVEGDIFWRDDAFILKLQVADPEDVYFLSMRQFDQPGNFIARGGGFIITYSVGQRYLRDADWAPRRVSVPAIFVLSPRARFTYCCPPDSDPGRPWEDLIGPSPRLPDVFKTSKFTHRLLPTGDIEQTREEQGNRIVTLFSAKHDMVVARLTTCDPQGALLHRIEYTYVKGGNRRVLPAGFIVEKLNAKTKKVERFEYEYSNVVIPDATPASAFTRTAVLARIQRETGYVKRQSRQTEPRLDDATLGSLARDLKENGTAKP
jgi:hypothetical protein